MVTREKRRHGKDPVRYRVADDTHIKMSRFLSHDQTQADLADYLGSKMQEYSMNLPLHVIVSVSGRTTSNRNVCFG